MAYDNIRIERSDGAAVVILDREPVNAIDLRLLHDASLAFDEIEADRDVRALVLTGAGRAFSAGLDLKSVPGYSAQEQHELIRVINRLILRVYASPIPSVAAVNGHAIAGGLCLALACDYRVGPRSGARLGLTETRAGIPFPAGPMAVVRAELSPSVVRHLTLVARNSEPEEALKMGILDELQAAEDVLPRALEVARDLGASPRDAYERVKNQVRGDVIERIREIVENDSDPLLKTWLSTDARAASAAILSGERET
jgi:enoyl-CoA hydratase